MKKTLLAMAMTGVVAGCSTPPETPADPKLDSTDEKVSYGMGLVLGERMGNDLPNLQMDQFLQGIQPGHAGDEEAKRMSREEIQKALMEYQQSLQESKASKLKSWPRKTVKPGRSSLARKVRRVVMKQPVPGLRSEVWERVKVNSRVQPIPYRCTTPVSCFPVRFLTALASAASQLHLL